MAALENFAGTHRAHARGGAFRLGAAFAMALVLPSGQAAEPPAPPITALAIAPDGNSALAGSQAGLRQVSWPDLAELGRLKEGTPKTALPHVHDLAFSPRGDLLA